MNARSADAVLGHARLAPDALWRRPPDGAPQMGSARASRRRQRRRRPVRHLLDERDPDRRRADALQLCAEDDGARRARLADGNRDDGVRRRIRRGRRCGVIRRVCCVETAAPPLLLSDRCLRGGGARGAAAAMVAAACEGVEVATAAIPQERVARVAENRQPRHVQPPHVLAMAVVASSLTERFRRSISHERGSGVSLPPCFRRFLRSTCARDHPQSTGFSRLGAVPSAASIFAVAAFRTSCCTRMAMAVEAQPQRDGVEPPLTAREHSQKPLRPVPIIVMHSASYWTRAARSICTGRSGAIYALFGGGGRDRTSAARRRTAESARLREMPAASLTCSSHV